MRIAAAVRVSAGGADLRAADIEERDAERAIDVTRSASRERAVAALLHEAIEPQVVIDADAQHEPRALEALEVVRPGLIFLGVDVRRDERDGFDSIRAHGFGETLQVARRRDDLDASFRRVRRCGERQRNDQQKTIISEQF
jgi:UTP:GlnB (protein PII) uridylyltransferase